MHTVRHEDRGPESHAAYFARQNPNIHAAAATAESLSEFLHGDLRALGVIVWKWLVLPVKNWHRRGKLHEEFAITEIYPEQAAADATLVRLSIEGTKETADHAAEEPHQPMAA